MKRKNLCHCKVLIKIFWYSDQFNMAVFMPLHMTSRFHRILSMHSTFSGLFNARRNGKNTFENLAKAFFLSDFKSFFRLRGVCDNSRVAVDGSRRRMRRHYDRLLNAVVSVNNWKRNVNLIILKTREDSLVDDDQI